MNESVFADRLTVDLSRSSVARYIQLSTLFRRRIEDGHWRVGTRLPTVDRLAAEFGVARATIRQALKLLAEEGLIETRRARGTVVIGRPEIDIVCEVETDWVGLSRGSYATKIEVLSMESLAVPPWSFEPDMLPARRYRHFRRRFSRDGVPYLIGDVYLDEAILSRVPDQVFRTKGTPQIISEDAGVEIGNARQVVTVGAADVETAELLDVPLNAPIVRIFRQAVAKDGTVLFCGEGLYRGDTVRLEIKLK